MSGGGMVSMKTCLCITIYGHEPFPESSAEDVIHSYISLLQSIMYETLELEFLVVTIKTKQRHMLRISAEV